MAAMLVSPCLIRMAYIGPRYKHWILFHRRKKMCNRYSITATSDQLSTRFQVDIPPAFYKPNYNAAPSQLLPVITSDSPQGVSLFYWGLPPERAQNKSISERIINLRAEAIQEKAIYKKSLRAHRCLIPADGYYTWKQLGKKDNHSISRNA